LAPSGAGGAGWAGGGASGPGQDNWGCGVIDKVNGSQGEANAGAARPRAQGPMTAPAKTILTRLFAGPVGVVRCDPIMCGRRFLVSGGGLSQSVVGFHLYVSSSLSGQWRYVRSSGAYAPSCRLMNHQKNDPSEPWCSRGRRLP
jgi:hypothetical protein